MGFFGGQITFIAVIMLIVLAFVLGFVSGILVMGFAIRETCAEAWEMFEVAVNKQKEKIKKKETDNAESC